MSGGPRRWDRTPGTQALVRRNPMHGNPLRTRADLQAAIRDLHAPLLPLYSEEGARLRIGVTTAHYGPAVAELEGFARPLWGLAPLVAGGGSFEDRELHLRGLSHGTDPAHPEYWGDMLHRDQRMVEVCAIAVSMLLAPATFWDPLDRTAKDRAVSWLLGINRQEPHDNNWLFFRIVTNLALCRVGEDWSRDAVLRALDRVDTFHLGDGYYSDGAEHQIDYYGPMAFHFYALLAASFAREDMVDRFARYRERARRFAQDFQHWFADDGAAIPFGRSMTYRFAQGAFWAACAFAGEEVLPWRRMKGLLLRHLRWWSDRPIAERDGVLSIGYGYPNLLVSETYNSPASPYWALKAFLVVALAEDHPFWMAEEEPAEEIPADPVHSAVSGFAVRRQSGDAVLLTGGQDGRQKRGWDAKYGRFAYSSAFAFSVASESWPPVEAGRGAVDSGMLISRDGVSWLTRGAITRSGMQDGLVWGRWQPGPGITVDSWLCFGPPGWHMRVHRIAADAPLHVAESGFAVDCGSERTNSPEVMFEGRAGHAFVRTPAAVSGIADELGARTAELVRAAPNTNLLCPMTVFPRLTGTVPAGVSLLATAVFASPDPNAIVEPPEMPGLLRELLDRLRSSDA